MKPKRFYFLFLIFLLSGIYSKAQREIKFDKITVDNGLSQSNINYIMQDNQGYLWFGTDGGLNRFDGSRFTIYTHNEFDSSSISNNIINHILEDKNHNLWISTQNGLNVFNKARETFTTFKKASNFYEGLTENNISCTIEDDLGNIWIGTSGGGLNKYIPETNKFEYFTNIPDNPESISSNYITCLQKDKYGFIWAGTKENGIFMLDPQTGKLLRYFNSDAGDNEQHLSSNRINTLYEDNEGDLWVGTSAGLDLIKSIKGIKRSLNNRDEIINMKNTLDFGQAISASNILSINQGASGLIWFGTVNNGLGYLNKYSHFAQAYTINPNNEFSLLSNKISSVYDDKSGILWIGTNAGINMIDRQSDRFTWHKRIPGLSNTLSSNNIQAIYKESSGVLWLGTYDKGLIKYDPETEIFTNFLENDYVVEGLSIVEKNRLLKKFDTRKSARKPDIVHFLSNNRIYAIHRDRSKKLWIGTGGGGLNVLNIASGSIRKFMHDPDNEKSISSDIIRCVFEDKKGRIWIGTEDSGLNLYENGQFKRYVSDNNDIFSIGGNDVRSIVEDEKGMLWIATFGGGLNMFNPEKEKFTRFIHIENDRQSLSGNSIYALYLDEDSKLWIGTTDGLNMLDITKKQFKHFNTHNGLMSNSIYAILDDFEGNIWVSTNKGISRINKSTHVIKNYDNEDGLQSTEFNIGAAFATRNGEMLFGGINGYCTFYPAEITDNKYKPDVLITNFKILNEEVTAGTPGSPLQKHISETDTLILSYKDVSLSFEFVALSFTDSKKNNYAYKMEPFETEWNYVGDRRFANYTNLDPGTYTFRVKASNNDGIWNQEGRSISIIVRPPFWKTWWFYLSASLFLFGSILILIQLRTRTLHKSKIMLENQVKLRTGQIETQNKILAKANSEIINQKNEIENQNKLLTLKNSEISKARQELNKSNEELVAINSGLEDMVAERTSSLKTINEELTNANNELDLFIYRASHDLKGPIARLLGMTLLAKMDNKDESLKEYITLIERGAIDINKVLNKLNNIHFINRENINRVEIDFDKMIRECKSNLSNYIEEEDLIIDLTVERNFSLRSDYILMKIIIENLLENAVIFKKTKKAEIYMELKSSDKSMVISIRDKGVGIQKDLIDKIFDMFYRGSERSKGNGLGLYLVRKAVQKLHGNIEVESEEGKYACFVISFPKVIVPKELKSLVN